jgi:hypothetical protein
VKLFKKAAETALENKQILLEPLQAQMEDPIWKNQLIK